MPHPSPAATGLDDTSTALLDRVQRHIPLVDCPFAVIADELGIDEHEAIDRVADLKDRGLIRQLSGIFDAASLGYQSSLVAARYDPARIDEAAAVISACPGVSHNYRRNHDFNLWYTVAVPPDRSLTATVDRLHVLSGALSTRLLPTLRRFKIGVRLDVAGSESASAKESLDGATQESRRGLGPLADRHIRAVRALQDDVPVCRRPFVGPAWREGFDTVEDLLEVGEELRAAGAMRRFSAILRHREAGFRANGMVVWKASPADAEHLGGIMASFSKVSHCYQRPTYDDWPYSLFTVIHGRSEAEVEECIAAISQATGLVDYRTLYSTVEYKKRRVRYFTDEWEDWERNVARPDEVADA